MANLPADQQGCAVPLLEQLRSVPLNAHHLVEINPTYHRNIPYGPWCHAAADEIERANLARLQAVHERDCAVEDVARMVTEIAQLQAVVALRNNEVAQLKLDVAQHEGNASEVIRLHALMRNVAGWLNNGCEPARAAAELLLVAGLPVDVTQPQTEKENGNTG